MDSALQISHRGEGPDPETSALGSDRHSLRCLCIGVNARCSYEACPAMKGPKKGILTGKNHKTVLSLQGFDDQDTIPGEPTETV